MTGAAAPYLSLAGVRKNFGAFTALDDVSLEVERGEMLLFLGPSGCGKTTLLRIIAGLETQDAGCIVQNGRDVSRLPAGKRDYGIVFQSYALFPNLTIFANVAYGLVNRRGKHAAIDARVRDLLSLVGLPDAGAKFPGQLSGGQQQRVALARALAPAPGLLLLDEPLSALDALERLRLRGEIRALQQRLGVTTIMVTHDQEEALSMADRIVVMNQGRIEQVGAPRAVYETPATPFTADFIGKVNVLPAMCEGGGRFKVGTLSLVVAGSTHSQGTAVRLYLRPEDIALQANGAHAPNAVVATVAKVEFLGAFCLVRVTLASAETPALVLNVSRHAADAAGLAQGAQVTLCLPPEALRILR